MEQQRIEGSILRPWPLNGGAWSCGAQRI